MATRHKPNRGRPGPEIELGDPFGQYEKQGGAFDGASESGDLASRTYGVPQADIPGGVNHLVNTQTIPAKTIHKGAQPADYHKFHGVPPQDLELYTFPPKADEVGKLERPVPVPKWQEAVPVYEVEGPEKGPRTLRKLYAYNIRVHASTSAEVTRICDRDDRRVKLKVLNEDSAVDIRISSQEEELMVASAQGTGGAGAGALIWHGTNSYTDLEECQDAMYALTTSGSSALLSVLIITEVPLTEN